MYIDNKHYYPNDIGVDFTTPILGTSNGKPCVIIPEYDFGLDFREAVYRDMTAEYGIKPHDINVIDYRLVTEGEGSAKHYVLFATIPSMNKTVAYNVRLFAQEEETLINRFAVIPVLNEKIRADIERTILSTSDQDVIRRRLIEKYADWVNSANPDLSKLFCLKPWSAKNVHGVLHMWLDRIGYYLPED